MNAKEKIVYLAWSRGMSAMMDESDRQFKLMQELFEEKGGGNASCCLEHNLFYLLSSSDEQTRGRALTIYENFCRAEAQYDAWMRLAQGFADIK